jgi:hypothetical protein
MESGAVFQFFTLLALVAAFIAFLQSWRVNTHLRALSLWAQRNQPERWQALPWLHRSLGRPAIERLRREGLGEDPEFEAHYAAYRRALRRLMHAGTAGLAMIALAILSQWLA